MAVSLSLACPSMIAPGANADLSALIVSRGTLMPAFRPDVTSYFVIVGTDAADITVEVAKADANATTSAGRIDKSLEVGANRIVISVVAQDGVTKKDYMVMVDRAGAYSSANVGELLYVPAGRFRRDGNSSNVSVVSRPFRMGRTEITRSQFKDIMGVDPSDASVSSGLGDPAQRITWYGAIAFCNKLSVKEGLVPAYAVRGVVDWAVLAFSGIPTVEDADWNAVTCDPNANGYRLPTEMEWMWAAMGSPATGRDGGTDAVGYAKAFAGEISGAALDGFAWYMGNSGSRTNPAGTKTANELGLCDLSGNVWELCWDTDGAFPAGELLDYRGAGIGSSHVRRGGYYASPATECTVATRSVSSVTWASRFTGIRVVRN